MSQAGKNSGPNWSWHFLKLMGAIIFLSPWVGALLYLLGSGFLPTGREPIETAIAGAKLGLLIGGFASPLLALALTTRAILRKQSSRGPETTDD